MVFMSIVFLEIKPFGCWQFFEKLNLDRGAKRRKIYKTENDIQQNQMVTNKENPERDFLRDHQS